MCNREFKNSRTLGIHISTTHKMSKQEYYDKFLRKDKNEGECLECGKETNFITLVKGYRMFCSRKCLNGSQYHIKHCTETYTKNYVDNKDNRKELNERTRNTCLEKYNAENVYASNLIIQKIKETNLERYDETSWTKSKEGREFLKNFTNSEDFKNKQHETKKKNNSFKTSKIEKELEIKLKEVFPNLETQYKSELYPFNCDFYIPSLDLYIEYNGSWTHGVCFYDENNEENRNTLEKWKQASEHSRFYQNAIETWTIRDLNKLNTALKNNLNYVAWFNKEQAYDWIEKYNENVK